MVKGLRLGPMGDVVLRSHLSCLAHLEAEEEAIRAKVDEIAHTPPYARPVQWLMAFRVSHGAWHHVRAQKLAPGRIVATLLAG